MMATWTRDWITGEEYAAERKRMIEAGLRSDSLEWRGLDRRVDSRNDHIWEQFGQELLRQHRGKWAAISLSGESVVSDTELEAMRAGKKRFGAANFCLRRLDEA